MNANTTSLRNTFVILLLAVFSYIPGKAQVDYVIGTGTNLNTCTGMPTPFYDYYMSNRNQYLYLASELIAAGMGPGVITALKWDVKSLCNVAPLNQYTVTIGTTNVNTLTAWVPNISTPVFGPATYMPFVGMNDFPFSAPFYWNGTDNIIIEICHNNVGLGYTQNAVVEYTTPSGYNPMFYANNDGSNQCNGGTYSYTYTSRPNVIFTYGIPCNGVPVTDVQGITEICPDIGFDLSFTNFYSGITVTWQKSKDGFNWTNFTGSVNAVGVLRDSIREDTYYRAIIICNSNGLSYTTPPHLVKISKFYYCYCENESIEPSSGQNKVNIGRVKISGLPANDVRLDNITVTGSQVNNPNADKNYSDFRRTLPPVRVYADSNFQIEVSQFNSGNALTSATVLVFVDYDRDGIFQYYERVHGSNTLNAAVPGEVKATFKLSDTAHIGLTGMRVIINQGNGVPDSCGLYPNGETEDYLIDIRYDPCTGPVNAGIIEATDTSMCPGYMYGLTDTTYEDKFSEIAKLWQMSADDIVWNDIPGSEFKDTLQRIFDYNQPFYYRLRMVCDATDDTSYSNLVRVNNKPGYKCYCFSQSEGGLSIDTSDLGGLKFAGFDLQQGGSHLRNPFARYQRKDFTDYSPIDLDIDSTYTMNIAHTMPGSHHGDAKVTVFMDFNNNKVYDIPEDRVFMGFTSSGTFVLHPDIHIPSNAIAEVPTGMRIIINNDIAPNAASDSACGTYLSGETEDYIVMFHRRFPANVNALDKLSDMQVYPNPTTGKFRVSFLLPGSTENVHLTVTNVTGQKIFTNAYNHQGGRFSEEIDMQGATPGVYFVELKANGQKQVQRLTVR